MPKMSTSATAYLSVKVCNLIFLLRAYLNLEISKDILGLVISTETLQKQSKFEIDDIGHQLLDAVNTKEILRRTPVKSSQTF